MGYFDGLVDGLFKKDSQGRSLFYPWGILGYGFIVETEAQHIQIRSHIKKIYVATLPAIIIIQITFGIWLNLILLPAFYIWYYFTIKKISHNLEKATEVLKISEAYKNSSESHDLPMLILGEVFSIGFIVAGLWMLANDKKPFIGFLSVCFFGFGAITFGYMILTKVRNK